MSKKISVMFGVLVIGLVLAHPVSAHSGMMDRAWGDEASSSTATDESPQENWGDMGSMMSYMMGGARGIGWTPYGFVGGALGLLIEGELAVLLAVLIRYFWVKGQGK